MRLRLQRFLANAARLADQHLLRPGSQAWDRWHAPAPPTSPERITPPQIHTAVTTDHPADPGTVLHGEHHHPAAGTREYQLYLPPGTGPAQRPLLVLLHGCTQDPDDFALGTAMNTLARQHGLMVLYPSQARQANPQRCWNWFKQPHQQRDRGEPALLASLTRAIVAEYGADPERVWVAGLSAGGAMASILGDAYPDLYAAVGVHSGLPTGAADGALAALAAMRDGATPSRPASPQPAPPTIVFHGDADDTVHPRNGQAVVHALLARENQPMVVEHMPWLAPPASLPGERRVYRDGTGQVRAEHWQIQGLGHAWSGGNPQGRYTDARGPDASAEMLRFFFRHGRRQGRGH